jgi:WD40 repeat protein
LLARIWRTDNWQKALEPLEHKYSAFGGEFSSDGRKLLTLSEKAALLWDLETGRHRRLDHGDFVYSAKFSPSGQWIATSSWDDTAAIWDVATGRRSLPLMKHGNADVFETVGSRDGFLLATGSAGRRPHSLPSLGGLGAAQVWDANTADPVSPPLRRGERVARLTFSADSRRLVSADRAGTAISWKLDPDLRPLGDLRMLAELLARRRVDDVSGLVPLTTDELKSRWDQLRPKYPESFTSPAAAVAAWERGDQ